MQELINLLDKFGINFEEDATGIIFKTNLKGLQAIEFDKRLNAIEIKYHFCVEVQDLSGSNRVCERTYKVSHKWHGGEN